MARVYDFWLGGKDNYAADRAVAEQVAAAYPDVRAAVRVQRAFLARAVAEGVNRYNEQAAVPVSARTHAEVCRFFEGLDLLEPGVVQVHRWRAGAGELGNSRDLAIYAGVGRKP
jgi:hypothetical protein